MNYRIIIFGLLEMVGGLTLGGASLKLLIDQLDTGDLNQSIIRAALCFLVFAFIGISGFGLVYNKLHICTNFIYGMLGCAAGLVFGILFSAALYNPLVIATCTVCAGTIGFNIGLAKGSKLMS